MKSSKNLDSLVNFYRQEFKRQTEEEVNLSNGSEKSYLREDTTDILRKSLNKSSSIKGKGKVKVSSDGTKYISFM